MKLEQIRRMTASLQEMESCLVDLAVLLENNPDVKFDMTDQNGVDLAAHITDQSEFLKNVLVQTRTKLRGVILDRGGKL